MKTCVEPPSRCLMETKRLAHSPAGGIATVQDFSLGVGGWLSVKRGVPLFVRSLMFSKRNVLMYFTLWQTDRPVC